MRRSNKFLLTFGVLALRSQSDYPVGQVDTTGITLWELVNRWGLLPPAPITAQ